MLESALLLLLLLLLSELVECCWWSLVLASSESDSSSSASFSFSLCLGLRSRRLFLLAWSELAVRLGRAVGVSEAVDMRPGDLFLTFDLEKIC